MSIEVLNQTNETVEQAQEILSKAVYLSTAGALTTIAILGGIMNLIVILMILIEKQILLTPVNVALLNLMICDFCIAIMGIPLAAVSAFTGRWFWNNKGCLWYAWFMATFELASIASLTILAIERWILIRWPTVLFTMCRATYAVLGVWIYSLSLTIPPFFGWGSYGPAAGNIWCSVSWADKNPSNGSHSYIAFLFFFGFIMPFILMIWSYVSMMRTLKKVTIRAGSRRAHEAKMGKIVFIMIVAFLTSWLPYAMMAFSVRYLQMTPSPSIAILPTLLAKSSICYNPIIYAAMNTQFWNLMKIRCGCAGANAVRFRPALRY